MDSVASHVRTYRDEDLGRVMGLWEVEGLLSVGPEGLNVDEATELMASPGTEVWVAERDGDVVAVALGAVSGVIGSIFSLVGEDQECDRLLVKLEERLAERGARKLVAGVQESGRLRERLADHGYQHVPDRVVLERELPPTALDQSAVSELGGQMIDPGLWDSLMGIEDAKQLIERRVILPLGEPDLATRHGVASPRSVLLFGPPGTGKTTFAKGIAARLEWPFIEMEASQLAEEGAKQQPRLLVQTIDRLLDLSAAVVFLDEIEDIASTRHEDRKVSRRVTTELLRQLPRLREAPHHLLVCATNLVSRLDPAFLRPGRFDYVLPVGPPNEAAREAMWRRYAEEITDEAIDLDAIVRASERFTPADIEFTARKAAQMAFEREFFDSTKHRATTQEFLAAIEQTRPSLTDEMIEGFEQDMERFARH